MYNVLLNSEILKTTRTYIEQSFPLTEDWEKQEPVPAGTLELIQSLTTRAENEWRQEQDAFRRCYRVQGHLEIGVLNLITRATAAAELLNKCNYVITYSPAAYPEPSLEETRRLRQPFIDESCRLLRLVMSIVDALQVKTFVREIQNPLPDLWLRSDEHQQIFVRKLRMSYAEHLGNLAVRIFEMYSSALPVELKMVRLRAQVYRNQAAVLIDLARAEEEQQKECDKLKTWPPVKENPDAPTDDAGDGSGK